MVIIQWMVDIVISHWTHTHVHGLTLVEIVIAVILTHNHIFKHTVAIKYSDTDKQTATAALISIFGENVSDPQVILQQ